jgi:carbon starvation protein CstA
MITLLISIALLIIGYFTYGKFLEKFVGASASRATPVTTMADGVDYKELKPWKIFIIQFLNIAGLGPIFGAILGAAYGPIAYLWIVLGCIFMGGAHDYFSGMLSIRHNGESSPNIVGIYLGKWAKRFLIIFTTLLLIPVGASFVTGPADLIASLTHLHKYIWLFAIFAYYIVATLLPIDKIIGKIYPYMGALLIIMALGVFAALIIQGIGGEITLTELTPSTFHNYHNDPNSNILIPMMFIVISCGAISGFHSTQSPLMARCMSNEKYGRPCFYGAMIAEGFVALIWATAAISYFGGPEGLNAAVAEGKTPSIIVNEICNTWFGKIGAIVAILGVVICPLSSGDTAFRSLRLIIADSIKYNQKPFKNRLIVAIPLFIAAYLVCTLDFSVIWKYVGIGNQILATIMLWTFSAYLAKNKKFHYIMSIPATLLTFICVSYFLIAPLGAGGISLNHQFSYIAGGAVALILELIFIYNAKKQQIAIK